MNIFRRLTAWLGRKSRTRQRRKLYAQLIEIGKLRAKFPDRQGQFFADAAGIMDRLDAITLAEDMAGIEARIKPAPLWPGLPTEGHRAPVVQDEVASRIRSRVIGAVGGLVLTVVILIHLMGQA